ncbi:SpoIIE family protein phosphatase [Candidatus Binatia bacterium]|nr:SpoIIE family protein phosphatase [Candidatus Binatia bacterium]
MTEKASVAPAAAAATRKVRRGLAFRLTVLVFAGGGTVVALMLAYNYHVARRLILAEAERGATNLARSAVNHVGAVVQSTARVPDYLGVLLSNSDYTEDEILALVRTTVEASPTTYGSTIAFAPYGFDRQRQYFAPYFYRKDPGTIDLRWLGGDTYHYFTMSWFERPRDLGHGTWSEPYFDEGGGNILMATYSAPFTRISDAQARFAGVVTADMALDWLEAYVASLRLYNSGYAFLISKAGTIITHPRREYVLRETIFSLAERQRNADLRRIAEDMVHDGTGVGRAYSTVAESDSFFVYAPVPSTGWTLAVVFPEDDLLDDVVALTYAQIGLATTGGALLLLVVVAISRSIARPLVTLSTATEEIARGNLDTPLPEVRSTDEIGTLATAFRQMQGDLKAYLAEHDQLVAIRSELDVARRIQQSILPRRFPPFPDHPEIEIFAEMLPAREVGGDFYDIFLVDDAHVGFAIADVSGKGIPAAIFMAMTRTLLRSTAVSGLTPGECLRRVNRLLCLENNAAMFVTLFYGILDLESGHLDYANGGHNPPFVLRADGSAESLPGTGGTALGVLDHLHYGVATSRLQPGDGLLLYTDGVTEAMDPEGSLFTEARLRVVLDTLKGLTPVAVIHAVLDAVDKWGSTAPQSDDVTVLAIRWTGGEADA